MTRRALLLVAGALAGCGSLAVSELPPPAGPSSQVEIGAAAVAELRTRERVLVERDARTGAERGRVDVGVGPVAVVSDGRRFLYVTDAVGNALLVVRREPLEVVRRVALSGRPTVMAIDTRRRRLWVGLARTGKVAELRSTARPLIVREWPGVPRPQSIAVDRATGRVRVTGAGGAGRTLGPPR